MGRIDNRLIVLDDRAATRFAEEFKASTEAGVGGKRKYFTEHACVEIYWTSSRWAVQADVVYHDGEFADNGGVALIEVDEAYVEKWAAEMDRFLGMPAGSTLSSDRAFLSGRGAADQAR